MEFIDINSWFFDKKWIYDELLKIKDQRIPKMNTSEKIFKLTSQMISKFQRDQNCQILIYILTVIDPKSQHSNSDWKWIVLGQTSNWGLKSTQNLMNLLSTESWWNKKYSEIRIKWFGIRIREISFFQNQKNFILKLGKIEEHYELKLKINDLNLIKTQITIW